MDIGNRLGESGNVRDAYIKQVDESTIEGYVVTEPEYVKSIRQVQLCLCILCKAEPISQFCKCFIQR